MNLLIAGGTGLLGTNWAQLLRHSENILLGCHKRILRINGVSAAVIDFSSVDQLAITIEEKNIDLVINSIGLTNVETCQKAPLIATHCNATIPGNIAKACHIKGVRMVHISTDQLFDGSKAFSNEYDIPEPLNKYAETKLQGEQNVLKEHPNALVVRTNFFGWGPSHRRSFSDLIIDSINNKKHIKLFSDVYFTPIAIENLINTIYELVNQYEFGIFNVAGDERISKFEFGISLANSLCIKDRYINDATIEERADLVKRPKDMSLSNTKVREKLGREMGSTLDQINTLIAQDTNGFRKSMQYLV